MTIRLRIASPDWLRGLALACLLGAFQVLCHAQDTQGKWTYAAKGRPPNDGSSNHRRNLRICEGVLRYLNSFPWVAEEVAEYVGFKEAVIQFKGFEELPLAPINAELNRELLADLLRYQHLGHDRYFELKNGSMAQWPLAIFAAQLDLMLAEGWTFERWTGPLFRAYQGGFSGPERTVIRRRRPVEVRGLADGQATVASRDGPRVNFEAGVIAYVTPELTGPDPTLPPSTSGVTIYSTLLLYEGHPYFVEAFGSIWTPNRARIYQACEFNFVPTKKWRRL